MKNILKFVFVSVVFVFVFQISFIENVNAQLIPATRDANNWIWYLDTEKCSYFKDDYGNQKWFCVVRRVEKSESYYMECICEFKREIGYSRKDSFAYFCMPVVLFYSLDGKLKDSDIQENLPFEPATYGSVADSVLKALLKYLANK